MSYALRVLITQNITETDEIKNIINIYNTKHECSTKYEPIPPSVHRSQTRCVLALDGIGCILY